MASKPPAKRWAVILVHGVGDTTPGHFIDAVAPALQASNPVLAFTPQTELHQIPSPAEPAGTFPALVRRGEAGADTVALAEVYWADLSRVGISSYRVVGSLFRAVYGLRHVALQSARIGGGLGAALEATLRIPIALIQGPVYAVFLFELLLCLVYLALLPDGWDAPNGMRAPALIVYGLVGCLFVAGGVRWQGRSSGFAILCFGFLLIGVCLLVHTFLRGTGVADGWYVNRVYPKLNLKEGQVPGEWMLVVFIMDAVTDQIFSVVAWCLILTGLLAVGARVVRDRPAARSAWTAWLVVILLVALWELAVEPINLIAQYAYDKSREDKTPTFTLWYNLICLFSLGIGLAVCLSVAGLVLVRRAAVGRRPPRLIVPWFAQLLLVVFAVSLFVCHILDATGKYDLRVRRIDYRLVHLVYLTTFALLVAFSVRCRNILHIVSDIVVHFASPWSNGVFDHGGADHFPVRERIAARFRGVVELLTKDEPTHLLIIAHSQGTVVVLDEVMSNGLTLSRDTSSTALLTFGSPLTNLYQHYFPNRYSGSPSVGWNRLRKAIRTWVNVFRTDDYVGTEVRSPDQGRPHNVPLPPGGGLRGHTRYWEPGVFSHPAILQLVP